MRTTCCRRLLIAVAAVAGFAGCSKTLPETVAQVNPAAARGAETDPMAAARRMGYLPMTQPELSPEKYRSAIAAAVAELARKGESASDFLVRVVPGDEKTGQYQPTGRTEFRPYYAAGTEPRPDLLLVSLWSRGALNQTNVLGNPDGKSREMHFEIKTGKIVATLYWQ